MTIELIGGPNDGDKIIRDKPLRSKTIWTDGVPGHVTIYLATHQNRHQYEQRNESTYDYKGKLVL